MKQPLKSPPQTAPINIRRRCAFRSNSISWCKKLRKVCDAPTEYNLCSSYQPKPAKTKLKLPKNEQNICENKEAASSHALLIGIKTGQCDICKSNKKTLLLRFGFSLCQDCLNICTTILEQLQFDETQQSKEKTTIDREPNLSSRTKIQKKVLP
ncbi:MAG: hypothetical protein M1167_04545 [Chloroflexi bacterium]|nr:hypothetical protein [Chloroflexota bacterium]